MSRSYITVLIVGVLGFAVGSLAVAALLFGRSFFTITDRTVSEPTPITVVVESPSSEPASPTASPADTAEPSPTGAVSSPTTEAPSPTPETAAPATPTGIAVSNTTVQFVQAQSNINIRSGPGTGYNVVGWVAAGQTAKVTGVHEPSGWWRVICPDDSIGSCWVTGNSAFTRPASAPVIQPTPAQPTPAPATPTPIVVSDTPVKYVQAQTNLNIRSGPGTGYKVVGWIAAGQTALVTGVHTPTGWWRVICPDDTIGSCWVIGGSRYTQPINAPGNPPTPTTPSPTACTDRASLVADVTVPDNSQFAPNTGFNKTWRIKNTGTCTWTNSYQVVHAGGTLMGAVASAFPLNQTVAPGRTADITISMVSPAANGTHQSDWKLQNAQGQPFGLGNGTIPFYVKIIVVTPGQESTISGIVFQDWNENGNYDGGDTVVPNQQVVLIAGTACHVAQASVATVTSGQDGVYTFKGNYVGNYCVGLKSTDGLEDVRGASVSPGQVLTGINLRAFAPLSSISGYLWNDYCSYSSSSSSEPQGNCVPNGTGGFRADGQIQPSETYIAGVTVLLRQGSCSANNAAPVSAVTNANGQYSFNNLSYGTYCVYIEAPSQSNASILLPGWFTFPGFDIWYHQVQLSQGQGANSVNFGWDHQFD